MTTDADIKRDEAIEHIFKAHKALYNALHPDTNGNNEYNEEYRDVMFESMVQLYKIHKNLKQ